MPRRTSRAWPSSASKADQAKELERLKAELRRDIESDLLEHESRLRVGADLELLLLQRTWDLIRDLAELDRSRDTVAEAQKRLVSLSACVPPEIQAVRELPMKYGPVLKKLGEAGAEGIDPSAWRDEVGRGLSEAFYGGHAAIVAWNDALWQQQRLLPTKAVSGTSLRVASAVSPSPT